MSGERYRLATTTLRGGKTNGHPERYVSPNVLNKEEAAERLAAEVLLHREAGWKVEVQEDATVVCARDGILREIKAIRSTPMDDFDPATITID